MTTKPTRYSDRPANRIRSGRKDAQLKRETELHDIQRQLEHWQDNVAARVADEAQALALEIGKLRNHELHQVWEVLRTAYEQVLAGTDMLRDLRRQLQDRQPTA